MKKQSLNHDFFKLKFSKQDMVTYQLAETYFNIVSSRYKHYIAYAFRKSNDPRETKYWHSFRKLYEIVKNDSNFNMYWYVEAQIKKTGKMVWPHQLVTKTAIENYHELLESKRVVVKSDNVKEILYALRQDAKNLHEWIKQNKRSIKSFFNDVPDGMLISDGIYYATMNFISPYFLSISKNFWRVYKTLDIDIKKELPSEEELKLKRNRIYNSDILKKKAKEYFGPEVII